MPPMGFKNRVGYCLLHYPRWLDLRKCENYMFCKPAGITLQGRFQLRIISDTGNIDVNVSELKQIDSQSNLNQQRFREFKETPTLIWDPIMVAPALPLVLQEGAGAGQGQQQPQPGPRQRPAAPRPGAAPVWWTAQPGTGCSLTRATAGASSNVLRCGS